MRQTPITCPGRARMGETRTSLLKLSTSSFLKLSFAISSLYSSKFACQKQVSKSARRVAEAQYAVAIVCACALSSVYSCFFDPITAALKECQIHFQTETGTAHHTQRFAARSRTALALTLGVAAVGSSLAVSDEFRQVAERCAALFFQTQRELQSTRTSQGSSLAAMSLSGRCHPCDGVVPGGVGGVGGCVDVPLQAAAQALMQAPVRHLLDFFDLISSARGLWNLPADRSRRADLEKLPSVQAAIHIGSSLSTSA